MKITITTAPAKKANTSIHPISQKNIADLLPKLCGELGLDAKLIARDFEANKGEKLELYAADSSKHILLGLGDDIENISFSKIIRKILFGLKNKIKGSIYLDLRAVEDINTMADLTEAASGAFVLAIYDVELLKTKVGSPEKKSVVLKELKILVKNAMRAAAQKGKARGEAIATSQRHIMELVDLPGNHLDATRLVKEAREAAKECGFSIKVFGKEKIKKLGMGALEAVNLGSHRPPAFILMEYKPKTNSKKKLPKVAILGKGVTFDTGGISIKGSTNMGYMKSDMGGAAAVLGAMEATARLGLDVHLIAAIPATDNMPDGKSIQPGDVVNAYGGISIEIDDTDAEGRLVLADALSYVSDKYSPDVMIDFATLTGSVVMALGYHAAGMFTQNDSLAKALKKAGKHSGDQVWRLPLWDDYAKQLHSDVADIKNYGGRPAGAVTAAKFLEKFTRNHSAWIHVDIAGTAFGSSPFAEGKSASGFGVKLVVSYLESLA